MKQGKRLSREENIDLKTVQSFGDEWSKFDQSVLSLAEHQALFNSYFHIFPWGEVGPSSVGFDMGCGSGRWAKLVAPRVGHLSCIDPSLEALAVAKKNLSGQTNVSFINGSTNEPRLAPSSQDFGYSLGVLHHIPNTAEAIEHCARLLRPGAPFLVYLYYNFENRPSWYRMIWRLSAFVRSIVSRFPPIGKRLITDPIALLVYFPLARIAWAGERIGLDTKNFPLYAYRNASLYTMRTDSRDRFGTPLEQRFSRAEITLMMERGGLENIEFSERGPYWCAIGWKRDGTSL
jgi:ubiquinone/menaquinone biosynthesis C-methylase UbiE